MAAVVAPSPSASDRVWQTVALLRRRGFAVPPARLAELCAGGSLSESEVRWAVSASPDLSIAEDLVVDHRSLGRVKEIHRRALTHLTDSQVYIEMTLRYVRRLLQVAPFVRSVSIAGSLASGGFRASDDVDLNLIVDDGYRHIAYVVVNSLGLLHALGHRAKPVDDLTCRPIAPRLMTANLILEHSQCFPLQRDDEDMAFELLIAEPVFGLETVNELLDANPMLLDHFPQLAEKRAPLLIEPPERRMPAFLFPKFLNGAARAFGEHAWRYMQRTRRNQPAALARVAYLCSQMPPYTLFDR